MTYNHSMGKSLLKHKRPSSTYQKRLRELKEAQNRIEAKMAILEKIINGMVKS
jgi:hypothetical protein